MTVLYKFTRSNAVFSRKRTKKKKIDSSNAL